MELCAIHTQFNLEKKGLLTGVTTWITLEDIMLNEISQSQKVNTI